MRGLVSGRNVRHAGCILFVLSVIGCSQPSIGAPLDQPRENLAIDRLTDVFQRAFEEDTSGRHLSCRCENFDFGEHLDSSHGGEVRRDPVVFWVGPAGDEHNEVLFPRFYNNPLSLFHVLGIPVSFAEGPDSANFSIVHRLAVDGLADSVSENAVFENNQCMIEFDDSLTLTFFHNVERLTDDDHRQRAVCVGNAVLVALGLPASLDASDVYQVVRIGDAPSGTTVEFSGNLVGMRMQTNIHCLTSAYRLVGPEAIAFEDYLLALVNARTAARSRIDRICGAAE